MCFTYRVVAATALLAAVPTQAQTPPGITPATSSNLEVQYGPTIVMPNALLPESLSPDAPTVSLNQTLSGTYMVMLVDQSIPQSSINTTGPQAPGLQPCRTTRLHWLQTDLAQLSNGSFTGNTPPIAHYGSPMPGLNDIAHTYVFWLFPQPANFTLPAWDAGLVYNPIDVYGRMNFSVPAIAAVAGAPVAANYIRVVNPNNTACGTASNGTCPFANSTTSTSGTGSPLPGPYTGAASVMSAWHGLTLVVIGSVACMLL